MDSRIRQTSTASPAKPGGVVSLFNPKTAVRFIPDYRVPELLRNRQIAVHPLTHSRETTTPVTWRPTRERADWTLGKNNKEKVARRGWPRAGRGWCASAFGDAHHQRELCCR
jgi:hypothetical protein